MCWSHEFDFSTIIHVNLHVRTDNPLEDLVHKPLVGRSNILQIERHYLIVIVRIVRHEGGFLSVLWVHAYLVVVKVRVQEIENFVGGCTIHQSVDIGSEYESLGHALLRFIVHTHPPLVVSLGVHDYIGQPSGVRPLL